MMRSTILSLASSMTGMVKSFVSSTLLMYLGADGSTNSPTLSQLPENGNKKDILVKSQIFQYIPIKNKYTSLILSINQNECETKLQIKLSKVKLLSVKDREIKRQYMSMPHIYEPHGTMKTKVEGRKLKYILEQSKIYT